MITDTGFMQRSGVAQVKTQSWYEAAKKSMIDLVECAKRTVLSKVEKLSKARTERREKQNLIGKKFS